MNSLTQAPATEDLIVINQEGLILDNTSSQYSGFDLGMPWIFVGADKNSAIYTLLPREKLIPTTTTTSSYVPSQVATNGSVAAPAPTTAAQSTTAASAVPAAPSMLLTAVPSGVAPSSAASSSGSSQTDSATNSQTTAPVVPAKSAQSFAGTLHFAANT